MVTVSQAKRVPSAYYSFFRKSSYNLEEQNSDEAIYANRESGLGRLLGVSKHQKDTAPVIVKHKHCSICATPIPMSKDFCSPACEDENKRLSRRRRYTFIATLALFPILMVLLMLLPRR